MRSLTRRAFVTTFALTLGLAGCASGGGGGGGGGGSANLITAEQLADMQQLDAYQAIQRLRSNWLRSRGGNPPQVMTDGMRQQGGLDTLRQYRVADIQEIRYMSAGDATNRYGTGFDGGAILITTKR
ncbi:MAG: hypothetical protein RJQ04_10565 [Longimicrobiales bacterium]